MTRRRLRLPAAIALLAVAAPALATQPDYGAAHSRLATIRGTARHLGAAVKQSSADFGRRVARGARQTGQQFNADMHQAGRSLHHWWDGARSSLARA
jgi:hypothetical protein